MYSHVLLIQNDKALVEDLLHLNSADKSVGRDHTRQVLLQSDAEHLQEQDVANLLLTLNNSKIDKAFDSVELIEHFGSLYKLLTAKCSDLRRFGIGAGHDRRVRSRA